MAGDETYSRLADELLRGYRDDPQAALRNPLMELSKQQFSGPFPTLDPLPPRHVLENYRRPAAVTEPVEKDLAGMLATPYAAGRTAGEFGTNAYEAMRYLDPAKAGAAGLSALELATMLGLPGVKGMPREVSPTGFYSQALEAAKNLQRKQGPAQGFLNDLSKAGVKKAEMEATGLDRLIATNPTLTKDQLVQHLTENRVPLQEAIYSNLGDRNGTVLGQDGYRQQGAKWADYALDPSNPTYRETVIHLPSATDNLRRRASQEQELVLAQMDALQTPAEQAGPEALRRLFENPEFQALDRRRKALEDARKNAVERSEVDFRAGHFSEPNVIAHARTSVQKDAQGRPVFLVDELQSDWGQKLRDGGARDEAKIAELKKRYASVRQGLPLGNIAKNALENANWDVAGASNAIQQVRKLNGIGKSEFKASDLDAALKELNKPSRTSREAISAGALAHAELRTAEASTPGHPLVNTTDQWTTTAMRKLLMDAVNAKAEGLAFTPGQLQVERYPGQKNPEGMRHAYDQMYPAMLESQLKRLDPQWPGRGETAIEYQPAGTVRRPGLEGEFSPAARSGAFSYFPLTPRIREEVAKGLPLFGAGAVAAPTLVDMLRQYDD